jgi:hypothetical protein
MIMLPVLLNQKYLHIFWGRKLVLGGIFVWMMFWGGIIFGLGILAQNRKKVKAE